jgi:hypothetical protein
MFIMQKICFLFFLFITINSFSQSVYDQRELFSPLFYQTNGNEYRAGNGEPGPKYWQNNADYKIEVTIDTIAEKISGSVAITYNNQSPQQLGEIWLQMDQNFYRKDSRATATTTASGGRWANTLFTNGFEIKGIKVNNQLTTDYLITDTRMKVRLPQTLASGTSLNLKIDYSFQIPEYGTDRMGRLKTKNGQIYEIAQWYPRLCVFDDIEGWNQLPYLGAGEFYLEYGNFEYQITAPANMIVVGSGELTNPLECLTPKQLAQWNAAKNSDATVVIQSESDVKMKPSKTGNNIWKFKCTMARDVAWAASRSFIWDAARINLPSGKKSLAMSVYPQEAAGKNAWKRSTEFVKGAIEHYSKQWFEYSYPVATNVAGIVGGMEYPGIVFCGSYSSGSGLWGVADHEFGHNWFPMIVGSNERKYAWMDEGFNTFINTLSTREFNKGEFSGSNDIVNEVSTGAASRLFGSNSEGLFNIPEVIQQGNLGNAAYYKPALALTLLREDILGKERFDEAFRTYIKRWAFKHPTPWDFFRTMEDIGGEDLGWFWRSWILNNYTLDVAVSAVDYENRSDPSKGVQVYIENLEKMAMPVTVKVTETNGKSTTIKFPVEIWQRGSKYSFFVNTSAKIKSVEVDPDFRLPDINRDNNILKTGN